MLRGARLVVDSASASFRAVAPGGLRVGSPLATAWPALASALAAAPRSGDRFAGAIVPEGADRALAFALQPLEAHAGRASAWLLSFDDVDLLPAAVVAHDLRSPLGAIALTAQALLARGGLSERQADAVDRIVEITRGAQQLVGDLLEVALLRTGGTLTLDRRAVRIEPVCARAIRQQLEAHPGGRVELALSGAGDGQWDERRLEQVVSNLVQNALVRCPAGEPVEVRAEGSADTLVLSVRNSGPPIPAEVQARLFEPFQRGDRRGGLGLGLYLVRELVTAHGGTVGLESRAGDGTRVTVRLPRSARGA